MTSRSSGSKRGAAKQRPRDGARAEGEARQGPAHGAGATIGERAPRAGSAGGAGAQPPCADLDRAKALVLRVLAFHARSEAQLQARLERAGFEAVAAQVLAWARRLGYLDDGAYARGRARALVASGRAGPRLVERKLAAAGIPRADARRAVAEALAERGGAAGEGGGGEAALCREALARKLRGQDPGALDPKARARAVRFLLGRGFSPEVVSRVLRTEID